MMKTTRSRGRWAALSLALFLAAADRVLSHLLGLEQIFPGMTAEGGVLLAWAIGHCDTLDGPVVTLARRALETGNVNHVLPRVCPEDEHEIRHAFEHAAAVRKLGPAVSRMPDHRITIGNKNDPAGLRARFRTQ